MLNSPLKVPIIKLSNSVMSSVLLAWPLIGLSWLAYQYGSIYLSCIVSLIITFFILRVESAKGSIDYFSPISFFSLLFFIGFVIRPYILYAFLDNFYRSDWLYSHEGFIRLSLKALFIGQIGYISFNLGYQFMVGGKTKPPVKKDCNPLKVNSLILFLSIIGLVGYGVYIMSSGFSPSEFLVASANVDKGGKYSLFATSWMFIVANLLYFYSLISRVEVKNYNLLFLVHSVMSVIISISFHDRKWLVIYIASLLIIYSYKKTKVTLTKISIFSILAIIILLGLKLIRNYSYALSESNTASIMWDDQTALFLVNQLILGGMFSYFDYFARLVDVFEYEKFMPLYNLKYFILSVFPQSVFEFDKPLPISQWVVNNYWTSKTSAPSPAVSVFGEFYTMGGLSAIILGLFSVGLVYGRIYSYFILYSEKYIHLILYILFFQNSLLIVRTMFFANFIGFLLMVSFFLFFWLIWKTGSIAYLITNFQIVENKSQRNKTYDD